jgi:hypothetical protein
MLYQTELMGEVRNNNVIYVIDGYTVDDLQLKLHESYQIKLSNVKISKIDTIGNISKGKDLYATTSRLRSFFTSFDCNFLRKEKLYTKLKYSRSPQYDIVSGGVAAIFSAFIGFLISEKFGLELVDSGDFYIAFMYCVFFSFSLRPLLRVTSKFNTTVSMLSLYCLPNLMIELSRFMFLKAASILNSFSIFIKVSVIFLFY